MEILFEFIGELFFEGIIEIIKNKKISKWIRYPLLLVMGVFYLALFVILSIIDFKLFMNKEVLLGILFLILLLIILIAFIVFIIKLAK